MRQLSEIVEIIKGNKAPKIFNEPRGGTHRYIQIEDLRPGSIWRYAYDDKGVLSTKNDVLIAWDGANAGTVGFNLEGYAGSTIAILRPKVSDIYGPFLGYFLHSQFQYIQDHCTGATIPHVSRSSLERFRLRIPPHPEQKRIAAILEKADRLRRQRHYALELSNTYLQSVFLEMFGDPAENPMKWDLAELSYVCDEIYRYPTFYGFQYTEKGTPVARIGNILSDGRLNPNLSDYVFIDPEISKRFPRTILELYDIVMAVRGDGSTVSRIGIVDSSNLIGANISPNLLLFRAKKDVISPMYLFHLMVSDAGQNLLEMYITRTAKKTITAQDIKQIKIPMPRKSLQEKFAQIVQKFERLRAQQREAERQAEHLFQTLLHQAFQRHVDLESEIVQDVSEEHSVERSVVDNQLTGSFLQLEMKY